MAYNEMNNHISMQPELQPGQYTPANTSADQFKSLTEIIQHLSLAKDIETVMFIVRKATRKLTGADGATFVLREGNQCYYADEDAIAPLWKGKRFPMSLCISGWVMEHCKSAVIADIYADPRIPVDAYRPTFVKSLLMVPIRTLNPIGSIGAYWAEYHQPTEEQIDLLKSLADSASVAMENIQLQSELLRGSKETSAQMEITRELMESNRNLEFTLKELNRRNEEMQWLKELSSALQTCIYIEEAYKLIAQYTTKLLPQSSGIFYGMHSSRNYLESMTSWGNPLSEEKIIKPDECFGLRKGSIHKTGNSQHDLVCVHCDANHKSSLYSCIPLIAQSDIIGLFYIEWGNTDIIEKANQDMLASMIAEQVAISLSNIKLRETLRNLSFRDTLTGLYNRRYLEETLEREMNRCGRKSLQLVIFMLDVDHFKNFNDKFGHEAGDMVLQALSSVLRNVAEKDDIACRYGGEEFIFVIPETTLEVAIQKANELHEAISHIHLRYGGVALTQITISIGVAIYPDDGQNMHALITNADTALYQAKNSGRNKTVVFKKEK